MDWVAGHPKECGPVHIIASTSFFLEVYIHGGVLPWLPHRPHDTSHVGPNSTLTNSFASALIKLLPDVSEERSRGHEGFALSWDCAL